MTLQDPAAVATALRTIVDGFGAASLGNPTLLRRVLADVLPDGRDDAKLIMIAAEAGIAAQLTEGMRRGLPREVVVPQVAWALVRDRSVDAASARGVVEQFAGVLGMSAPPVQPPPVQPPPVQPPPAQPPPAQFIAPVHPGPPTYGPPPRQAQPPARNPPVPVSDSRQVVSHPTQPVPAAAGWEAQQRPPSPSFQGSYSGPPSFPGQQPTTKSRTGLWVGAGIVLVLALAGGGAGAYALAGGSKPGPTPVVTSTSGDPSSSPPPSPAPTRTTTGSPGYPDVDALLLPDDVHGCGLPVGTAPRGLTAADTCRTSVSSISVTALQFDTAADLSSALTGINASYGYVVPDQAGSCPPGNAPALEEWSDTFHTDASRQPLECFSISGQNPAQVTNGAYYILAIPDENILYELVDTSSFAELDTYFRAFQP